MIPMPFVLPPTLSPRLIAELILVLLLAVSVGTAAMYRGLYKGAKGQATEQLSLAASESARLTAEALHLSYSERMRQIEQDRAVSDAVAKDAVARAARAETAVNKMRRDLNAEALEDACVGRPLSERTRERLRQLEADYAGREGQVRTSPRPR
jgi:hypothetical protein